MTHQDRPTGGSERATNWFGDDATDLSSADGALVLICSRILDSSAMDDLRQMLQDFQLDVMQRMYVILQTEDDKSK